MANLHEVYAEAETLKDNGKNEEAIAKLVDLLETDASFVLAHLALAVLYGKVGQHEDAIKHAQKACELDPNDPFHFTAMSVTFQRASQAVDNAQDNQRYIMHAEEAMARAHELEARR